MEDSDFERFLDQARILGLEGEAIVDYVNNARDRMERQKEREKEREAQAREREAQEREKEREVQAREREAQEKEREREAQERERVREAQEREREKERVAQEKEREAQAQREDKVLREREQERETQLKQLQLEIEKFRLEQEREKFRVEHQIHTPNVSNSDAGKTTRYPKIPLFDENKDDIDSFIFRFETYAKNLNWKEEEWAMLLGTHLQGSALNLFHSLSIAGMVQYPVLKEALLTKFQCSADGFREKFRTCRPEQEESFPSFSSKLSHLLDRWVELAKCEKTYKGLRNLFLCEQFLFSVSKDLATFLRERDCADIQTMVTNAEHFRLAHPTKSCSRSSKADFGLVASTQFSGQKNVVGRSQTGYASSRLLKPSSNDKSRTKQFRPEQDDRKTKTRVTNRTIVCHECGGIGHIKRECPTFLRHGPNKTKVGCVAESQISCQRILCSTSTPSGASLPVKEGLVNGYQVLVLRDSGATTAGVRKQLVRPDQYTGQTQKVISFGGNVEEFPVAKVQVQSPFYTGELECCVIEEPVADLILGNLHGVQPFAGLVVGDTHYTKAAVMTRAQKKNQDKISDSLKLSSEDFDIDPDELRRLQKEDVSLQNVRDQVGKSSELKANRNFPCYFYRDDVLLRRIDRNSDQIEQVVLPIALRKKVLFAAHDTLLAGHCGVKKTQRRVQNRFWWPGITRDVRLYCQSCEVCQKCSPKGRTPDIPLFKMPRIEEPFHRVAIDIVGPISPMSEKKHRYLLTIVDVATRFPEAIPLQSIDSVSVAEALFTVFCRLGFPREVLSDNGSQFTSEMFTEFLRLLSIKKVNSSPYHAQSNGVVERMHGTLKPMLKKLIQKQPTQWHRFIPALMFCIRESPNESTGFSPFELLFGRKPRGPIDFLADSWTGQANAQEARTVFEHVFELRNTIADTLTVAHDAVDIARKTQKHYHDKKSKHRTFGVGDRVLVFLPTSTNKLLMTWKGPYKIKEKLDFDYVIDMGGKSKIFHPNMLKKFFSRTETHAAVSVVCGDQISFEDILPSSYHIHTDVSLPTAVGLVAVISDDDDLSESGLPLPTLPVGEKESVEDIHFDPNLSLKQRREMTDIFGQFSSIMTADPGCYKLNVTHEINLTTDNPVQKKQYPLPFSAQETIKSEVKKMLDLGVIEHSQSDFSAPVVLVKKPDGSTRFCCDYRELNKVTRVDAEPIPDPEQLFSVLAKAKYFTKLDLSKGYWQILLKEEDKHKTAFQTPLGLFQWVRMPFGLTTAPATFARAMRNLNLERNAINFFDDILIHSVSWESHKLHVQRVLQALEQAGFTARPTKILVGFGELEFLGHVVGQGHCRPQPQKVEKIMNIPAPTTKRQVRSLLGLVGYYRKFIPNFATITVPITDLLSGKSTRKFVWTNECQTALQTLQNSLTSSPVLLLADLTKPFIVRTDASSTGIGGVLLQDCEGTLHPVTFVSRKLLPRETRYSTIERECLAIVWTISKLGRYLWGKQFHLETDHRPLAYLRSGRFKNARIMRWVLTLQEYNFSVASVKGADNLLADILSRAE